MKQFASLVNNPAELERAIQNPLYELSLEFAIDGDKQEEGGGFFDILYEMHENSMDVLKRNCGNDRC